MDQQIAKSTQKDNALPILAPYEEEWIPALELIRLPDHFGGRSNPAQPE